MYPQSPILCYGLHNNYCVHIRIDMYILLIFPVIFKYYKREGNVKTKEYEQPITYEQVIFRLH